MEIGNLKIFNLVTIGQYDGKVQGQLCALTMCENIGNFERSNKNKTIW